VGARFGSGSFFSSFWTFGSGGGAFGVSGFFSKSSVFGGSAFAASTFAGSGLAVSSFAVRGACGGFLMAFTTFACFGGGGSSFEEHPDHNRSAITEMEIMGSETFINPSYDLDRHQSTFSVQVRQNPQLFEQVLFFLY
jgi:hypothetical protein